jgi:hypothetical protein
MVRLLAAGVMLLALASPAAAQFPGQYNPDMAVPAPILPPTPPAAQPGMAPPPAVLGRSSRQNPAKPVPPIEVGRPARPTFNDRATACSDQAAASGVPAGAVLRYQNRCMESGR